MLQGNSLLYRTLSCRTSVLAKPVDPVRALMLLFLAGFAGGTVLLCTAPELARQTWLTQGMLYTDTLRTLWDVFCTAAVPVLLLLGGVLLLSSWGCGQPLLLLLLIWRGLASGIAAADCFERFGLRTGLLTAGALILPLAMISALLLVFPLRDALSLTCRVAGYLLRGHADEDIAAKQHKTVVSVLRAMLLMIPAAGLHTWLVWLMDKKGILL